MADTASSAAPLDGVRGPIGGPHDAGVTLAERPHLAKLNLRGDATDKGFVDAVASALGTPPPLEPNTWTAGERDGGAVRVVWLGPDEWLVTAGTDREAELTSALRSALGDRHVAITDVSDNFDTLVIAGAKARALLAKGTMLDVHPRAFAAPKCAQTLLFRHRVTLAAVPAGNEEAFETLVRPSFAPHLWSMLTDGAAEYGVRIAAG